MIPISSRKRIRYLGLLWASLIYWGVVEMTRAIGAAQGAPRD